MSPAKPAIRVAIVPPAIGAIRELAPNAAVILDEVRDAKRRS